MTKAQEQTIITNARLKATALDFCIMKDCPARCDGEANWPVGWTMVSILRNNGPRLWQLRPCFAPNMPRRCWVSAR
jgi:hypothetical protein